MFDPGICIAEVEFIIKHEAINLWSLARIINSKPTFVIALTITLTFSIHVSIFYLRGNNVPGVRSPSNCLFVSLHESPEPVTSARGEVRSVTSASKWTSTAQLETA